MVVLIGFSLFQLWTINYCGINNWMDSIYIEWFDFGFGFPNMKLYVCDFKICDIGMKTVIWPGD